jgi:hypothetical protein
MEHPLEYITASATRSAANRVALVFALLIAAMRPANAQTAHAQKKDTTIVADKTFFTRRDLAVVALGIGASAGVSIFDERIAHWAQSPHIQGDSSRHDFVDVLTTVNEVPLTLGAVATYLVGRIAHQETVADVGLHATEALVLTVAMAEMIRAPLGRVRPRESDGDAFRFEPFTGFTKFENRSYPSLHSAVGFATAAALTQEINTRNPGATKFAAPVLFTAALIPGITRIYLNQHWASDVVSGGIMGAWLGTKVVRYAHGHRRSKLDKWLLGLSVIPDGSGGVMAAVTLPR